MQGKTRWISFWLSKNLITVSVGLMNSVLDFEQCFTNVITQPIILQQFFTLPYSLQMAFCKKFL